MTMGFDDAGGQRRQVLSVFDFDGTLTRHDSFVPFLKFAFGPREFNRRILRLALPVDRTHDWQQLQMREQSTQT